MQTENDKEFNAPLLVKLLEKIPAHPDRIGLSYAIPELLKAARAIHKLAPDSQDFAQLVASLEAAEKLDLPEHPAMQDVNPLHGSYGEYPIYALFTQRGKMGEPQDFKENFHVAAGLLLASVWLSDLLHQPPSGALAEFATGLRIIRKNKEWRKLGGLKLEAGSLSELVHLLTNQSANDEFVSRLHELAAGVSNKLGFEIQDVAGIRKQISEAQKRTSSPSVTTTIRQPREDGQKKSDFGEKDEWGAGRKKAARPVAVQRAPVLQAKEVVLKKPPAPRRGVDTAESDVTATVVEAPPEANEEALPDLVLQKLQVLDARYATEFDNQFLKFSWETLNNFEVQKLVSATKTTLADKNLTREVRVGALIAGLSIMTTRSPMDLASFVFLKARRKYNSNWPAILAANGCWYSPFPPLKRFVPNKNQRAWLKKVGNGCFLPLPKELLDGLFELALNGSVILKDALGYTEDELVNYTQDFCRNVRGDARLRTNMTWLRGVMFYQMLGLTGDDVGCVATLGNTEYAPSAGLYYASFEQQRWRETYCRATRDLAFTPAIMDATSNLPYGSRQLPIMDKLRAWNKNFSEQVGNKCRNARSLQEIIEAHNYYAAYTFLMLLTCTGHRPVNPYTFDIVSIDLDEGWILISDKITGPVTRLRLIALPKRAVKQLKNYLLHLRNYSRRIQAEYQELSEKISMLMDEPVHVLIPFFYWVAEDQSVLPIDTGLLEKKFGWPYEGNACRHFLSTGLRERGVCSEYIAILLGHVGVGQYGFGKFSALCPAAWRDGISEALDSLLESHGFANLNGLTHAREKILPIGSMRPALEKLPPLDCFKKVRAHVEESKLDLKVVRAAFNAAKQRTSLDSPRDVFLEVFRNEIAAQSVGAPDRLSSRLNLYVRYVRMHRHALNPSSIPGWVADMNGEDSLFEPDSLARAKHARQLRDALIPVAMEMGDKATLLERMALIQLSSILFGGLLRKKLVEQIPSKLFKCIRWFEGHLWVDFEDPQAGGAQRWFPDPFTSLLIARFIMQGKASGPVHSGHLRSSVSRLLKMAANKAGINQELSRLDDAIKISNAFFSLHLPGLVRAFAAGDIGSASLTEGCWLRLLSGRPLVVQEVEAARERDHMQKLRHVGQDAKLARTDTKAIFDAIRDAFPPANSGAVNNRGVQRNPLTRLFGNLNELCAARHDMPSVVAAIIGWANHLATEGSVITKNPAIGTIYSYITDIASPLIDFCSNVNFVELEESELTDIYQRVIDCGKVNNRHSRAQSLRWFHEFCEEEYDIAELDWGEVAPGIARGKTSVSANLITHEEYCHAKSFIMNHPGLDAHGREMHLAALIIIYRCGLRLGELLRLTVSDMIFEGKCVLLVRNGIYGKTKSHAGIRQVPWLDRLSEEEKGQVRKWVEHREGMTNKDPWAALFGIAGEARVLEARVGISRILTEVLRHATGDPSASIHHLRHGAGTSALSIVLSNGASGKTMDNACSWFQCSNIQEAAGEFREFHLGQQQSTRRIVYAIPQALGHSSPRTTCWHYGHLLDYSLHEHVAGLVSLKNVEVARLSGMSQNALNVAAHHNPGKTPAELALIWLLKNYDGARPTIQLADRPMERDVMPHRPVRPILSPKLVHIILSDLSSKFDVQKIAGRHVRELAEIEALGKCARQIERKTGYSRFVPVAQEGNKEPFIQQGKLDKLLTGRGMELQERMRQVLENPMAHEKLAEGLNIWEERYKRGRSGLWLPYADEQRKMVALLKLLGYEDEQIAIVGNSLNILDEATKSGGVKLPPDNQIKRAASYKSVRRIPLGVAPAPAFHVAGNPEKLKGSAHTRYGGASIAMTKLHHILFLASVIISARKTIEAQQATPQ